MQTHPIRLRVQYQNATNTDPTVWHNAYFGLVADEECLERVIETAREHDPQVEPEQDASERDTSSLVELVMLSRPMQGDDTDDDAFLRMTEYAKQEGNYTTIDAWTVTERVIPFAQAMLSSFLNTPQKGPDTHEST